MGRSKSARVASSPEAGLSKARLRRSFTGDSFPRNFLVFLSKLPSDDPPDEAAEPPKKRARTDAVDSITVARETFTISRKLETPLVPGIGSVSCVDVGRYVKFHLDEGAQCLHITSHPRSPFGAFEFELGLDGFNFQDRLLIMLKVTSKNRRNQHGEGTIWATVKINLELAVQKRSMTFSCELKWNPAAYVLRNLSERATSREVLDVFFPDPRLRQNEAIEQLSPQAFFDVACLPDESYDNMLSPSIPGLNPELYPYQRRALQWLLMREGVINVTTQRDKPVELQPLTESPAKLPFSFNVAKDADGSSVYVSSLLHAVTRDVSSFQRAELGWRGGILAEEMGLGKTVEIISLILTHKRPPHPAGSKIIDSYMRQEVQPTGATLIVTPATLRGQWISELEKHAPDIRVLLYDGMKTHIVRRNMKGLELIDDQLQTDLAAADVVITTYDVLQAEIHFAQAPPDRSMRHVRQYGRPKSPLTQLSWWRVCLDEAQQIESGVTSAAKLARLIPRVNAWGVSGTPVKDKIRDLFGLLLFLRYEPIVSYPASWESLITSHMHLFKSLFSEISLRHTKRAVRNELNLPAQNRYVISLPFMPVEQQEYQSQFKSLAAGFGLTENGEPLRDEWNPGDPRIIEAMRGGLARLRQLILHPQLSRPVRAALRGKRPLQTIDEVLETMIEQSEAKIRASQRDYFVAKIRRGQLLDNTPRIQEALEIWQEVLKEVNLLVVESRLQLKIELAKPERSDEQNDSQTESLYDSGKLGLYRKRLHSTLDIQHRAYFFIASAFYQIRMNEDMTAPDSEEFQQLAQLETNDYDNAKKIRKELLHDAYAKAFSFIDRIKDRAAEQSFAVIPELISTLPEGLESRRELENLTFLHGVLNEQANLLDDWREQVIHLLSRPLVDQEDGIEATGDEYEDSTKVQDDLMVYIIVLKAAVADRQSAFSGIQTELVRHETAAAQADARNGKGHSPEKMLLLLRQRSDFKTRLERGAHSYKTMVANLRELSSTLEVSASKGSDRARIELQIVQDIRKAVGNQISEQNKLNTGLEKEVELFTDAANARVDYYRQLQEISDQVGPYEKPPHLTEQHLRYQEEEHASLTTEALAKHRYLLHLGNSSQYEDRSCPICQSQFELGVMTICGHQACQECFNLWWKAHKNCPLCRKQLNNRSFHDITVRKQDLRLHCKDLPRASPSTSAGSEKVRQLGIYSEFNKEKIDVIKQIKLSGPSYTTKIAAIIRHILWLRTEDPGAKSVIFTQFSGFLNVLKEAFEHYHIGSVRFDSSGKSVARFKEDPCIECFLMDARAHASGLNLVNARHVILCEPILNTALELQAIARVDRIGQLHETTVWLYLVDGTVEESIYELSVKRRMAHMESSSNNDENSKKPMLSNLSLEEANSLELQQATLNKLMDKDRELGEAVGQDDLWQCLFGHVTRT